MDRTLFQLKTGFEDSLPGPGQLPVEVPPAINSVYKSILKNMEDNKTWVLIRNLLMILT